MSAPRSVGGMAELTIALSLATDLGTGQPMEHGLRTCLLSLSAAEHLGLDGGRRSCVYYTALLRFLGCTSDAADTAELAGGDDLAFNATFAPALLAGAGESMRFFVRHLAEDQPWHRRASRVVRALADTDGTRRSLSQHCEAGARLAGRLGLDDAVRHALAHAYERWDGKGYPDGLAGGDVPEAVRVVAVARDVELLARNGWEAAGHALRSRRGRGYDPAVADAFLAEGRRWLAAIGDDPATEVLAAEPSPAVTIPVDGLDHALGAVADFVDLKSPWFRGHSSAVATLVEAAAGAAGLDAADSALLRRAALVHDVGRVGVPNGIWDHAGPLSTEQWERVRMHSYLTERVLARSAVMAPFVDLAASHHERVDGSGYHRGITGDRLGLRGRLLAAADAFHAMTEARPYRPALDAAEAAEQLVADVDRGRFTRAEVDAVLAAADQRGRDPVVPRPAGLTEREVAVLRLIARGFTNRQVAARLGISAKTVGHHVEHIYAKSGVATRAGATLFAMEHDLLVT